MSALTTAEAAEFAEAEAVIARDLTGFVRVGGALAKIRDARLYREQYSTFEDYAERKWGLSRTYAYDVMAGAETVAALSAIADTPLPTNEGQARELRGLPPEQAAETMQRAAEATAGKVTAAAIRAARPEPEPEAVAAYEGRVEENRRRMAERRQAEQKLADYIDSDQSIQDLKYLRAVHDELSPVFRLHTFDMPRVARIANDDFVETVEHAYKALSEWRADFERERKAASGLRLVQGGNR